MNNFPVFTILKHYGGNGWHAYDVSSVYTSIQPISYDEGKISIIQ